MEKENQELVIILPENMENIPVRIIRNGHKEELIIKCIDQSSEENREDNHLHVAIYNHEHYDHLSMKDIFWVEATGSYCKIHTKNGKYMISFPLGHIQKSLPEHIFLRIHRSFLVNINHIKQISGNCVVVNGSYLKIGKEYRKKVLDRFIFLGVRNKPQ
ncbi:MAG TPA: LytTR family transcriptional regulator [Candidatus Bacteroides avicola]|uniref:LytTR family transcriptional regulator n=1 Tax=Candidatus Bacteroides avicola TaxID=2838468 RepID=A0A9D2HVH4_9BACE|nr:LytTR family transcriptional regulator [Candidatus Phocaeicola gallistercoris]HJA86034.1 LytTR family transcriptional regulator [Candidatus Bacteroides avicola]